MFGFSLLVEKALKGYTRALFGTKTLQHTFQILMRYTDCTCSLVVCVMQELRLRSLSFFRWACGISMPPCVPCDIPVVSCTSVPWYMRFITLKFFRIKCWLLYFCNPSICSLFIFSSFPPSPFLLVMLGWGGGSSGCKRHFHMNYLKSSKHSICNFFFLQPRMR